MKGDRCRNGNGHARFGEARATGAEVGPLFHDRTAVARRNAAGAAALSLPAQERDARKRRAPGAVRHGASADSHGAAGHVRAPAVLQPGRANLEERSQPMKYLCLVYIEEKK